MVCILPLLYKSKFSKRLSQRHMTKLHATLPWGLGSPRCKGEGGRASAPPKGETGSPTPFPFTRGLLTTKPIPRDTSLVDWPAVHADIMLENPQKKQILGQRKPTSLEKLRLQLKFTQPRVHVFPLTATDSPLEDEDPTPAMLERQRTR